MRLVLDTNLVLSGLLWRGTPYKLLEAIRQQHSRHQLFSSPALLAELTEVITRPTFAQRLKSIGKTPHDILADYMEVIEVVEPTSTPRIVRDADDDHVIACALAAKAAAIVSGDQDLIVLKQYQGIDILNAAEAIKKIDPQQ